MWLRLFALAVGAATVIVMLITPALAITGHVPADIPAAATVPSKEALTGSMASLEVLAEIFVVTLILMGSFWIAVRIVRSHG